MDVALFAIIDPTDPEGAFQSCDSQNKTELRKFRVANLHVYFVALLSRILAHHDLLLAKERSNALLTAGESTHPNEEEEATETTMSRASEIADTETEEEAPLQVAFPE